MSCGNAFDSNMPPFVNTRGTQKAVVSLQAWRPRRFGWECTEREKDWKSEGGSERWLETVYTSRCSSANPSLSAASGRAGSEWEMREGGVYPLSWLNTAP